MDNPLTTRMRIIAAGERLFAERGVHAVSLREIGAEAQQRNTGAVRYHFGSKQALVDAIFEHRMVPANARRLALLAEFDAEGTGHLAPSLARAFVLPLAEQLGTPGRPSWYLRFAVQATYAGHPDLTAMTADDLGAVPWTRSLMLVRDRVHALLAHLPEPIRQDRLAHFSGAATHALADRELRVHTGWTRGLTPTALFIAGLVDAATAVLDGPVSAETLRLAEETQARASAGPG